MPLFHFHLHECGEMLEDEEGRTFPNMEAAVAQAKLDALALLAAEVEKGRLCLGCRIEVVEADTGAVVQVPFKPLVQIVES